MAHSRKFDSEIDVIFSISSIYHFRCVDVLKLHLKIEDYRYDKMISYNKIKFH
ncbi:uncharacterized protein DS421_8g228280 [Arachis hypogaea]|nr:uncharacterized protein DS421_8g228280 [Arachis hypogaea]